MRPNLTSPLWLLGFILLALAFVSVSVTLMIDVIVKRYAQDAQVELIADLTQLDNSLRDLPRGVDADGQPGPDEDWESMIREAEMSCGRVLKLESLPPDLKQAIALVESSLKQADDARAELAVLEPGALTRRDVSNRFYGSIDTAADAVLAQVERESASLASLLEALAQRWRYTLALASVSIVIALTSVFLMVSDRRHLRALERAQFDLSRMENQLAAVVANAPIMFWSLDSDGVITLSEGAALEVIGVQPGELVGRSVFEVYEDGSSILRNVRQALAGVPASSTVELNNAVFQSYLIPVHDSAGRVVGANGVATNITERMRFESELRRSEEERHETQKNEAIGRVAGGVAHEFSNLLTVVSGFSSLLRDGFAQGTQERQDLDQVLKASRRAAELTQQLLAFSRQQRSEPRTVDLATVAEDSLKMLRTLVGETIRVDLAVVRRDWLVLVDPGQFQQVLVNLALNARDAMPDGGLLTLAIADAERREVTSNHALDPGPYVCLQVRDTGAGMEPEVLEHAFEPFFTTKGPSRGTGLGLPTCQGILRQGGGDITVESELGAGTCFRLYLPRQLGAASVTDTDTGEILLPVGRGTILLAEDEAMVRALTSRILREAGYQVIEAPGGEEALEICRSYEGNIELLVTDIIMPGIGGRELAKKLLALRPGTPVVFISGYAQEDPSLDYLQKPFTPEALCRAVRARLDSVGLGPAQGRSTGS